MNNKTNIFVYLKHNLSIVEVINHYTALRKYGGYLKGLCPFHEERTASFSVTPHKEIFYCFGCQQTGDVIGFISKIEHCSPLEAVHLLAEHYSIQLPEEYLQHSKNIQDTSHHQKKYYWSLIETVIAYAKSLYNNSMAHDYMNKRMVNTTSQRLFEVGFFPQGAQATQNFIEYMYAHNFLMKDLLEYALIINKGSSFYSPFAGRILFSIRDPLGRAIALAGRLLEESADRAKYYNLKETHLFSKGKTLFNFHAAKQSMHRKECVYLVEGYLDCIALVQQGFDNCVATMGTACTLEHLKLLSRYVGVIYVIYDADKAGYQAIMKLASMCWHVTIDIKIVELPAGQDPASLLAQQQSIALYIEQATDIFSFFVRYQSNGFSDKNLKDKISIFQKITDLLNTVQDPIKRTILFEQAAQSIGMPLKQSAPAVHVNNLVEHVTPTDIETKLFAALINTMTPLNSAELLLIDTLEQPFKNIIMHLQKELNKDKSITFVNFYATLSNEDQALINRVITQFDSYAQVKDVAALMKQVGHRRWKSVIKSIKEKIAVAQAHHQDETILLLLGQLKDLQQQSIIWYAD